MMHSIQVAKLNTKIIMRGVQLLLMLIGTNGYSEEFSSF